jgi:hypothetical protein
MRAISLAAVLACSLLSPSHAAALPPTNADEASMMQAEALGDRSPDRWQGRQHYLYDNDHRPNWETVCVEQPVGMRRSDGTTVVRRINRCK